MVRIKVLISFSVAHDSVSDRTLVAQFSGVSLHDAAGKLEHLFRTSCLGEVQWLPDGRRFVSEPFHFYELPARCYDADRREHLGCCFPCLGVDGWLTIGPTGHYQGSEGIESEFVYITHHNDGRLKTYTPAEFAAAFQWKNDPKRANFSEIVETVVKQ